MSLNIGPNTNNDNIRLIIDPMSYRTYPASGAYLYNAYDRSQSFALAGDYTITSNAITANASSAHAVGPASNAVVNAGVYDVTLEAWVKFTTTSPGTVIQIKGDTDNFTVMSITVNGSSTSLGSYYFSDGSYRSLNSSAGKNDNEWHQVVVDYGPSGTNLYVDGAFSNSNAYGFIGLSAGSTGPAVLFGRKTATDNGYVGSLGFVKIYERRLTAEEVAKNYKSYKSRFI